MKPAKYFKTLVPIIIVTFLLTALSGMTFYLSSITLISWKIPVLASLALALLAAIPLSKTLPRLTTCANRPVNYTVAVIIAGIVFVGAYYSINYFGADKESATRTEATITRKYTKERYHSNRVGRNHYVRGSKYHVYYIEACLPDSTLIDRQIPLSRYNRLKKGRKIPVEIRKGMLGAPVLSFPNQ